MPLMKRLSDTFWSYVSPHKAQGVVKPHDVGTTLPDRRRRHTIGGSKLRALPADVESMDDDTIPDLESPSGRRTQGKRKHRFSEGVTRSKRSRLEENDSIQLDEEMEDDFESSKAEYDDNDSRAQEDDDAVDSVGTDPEISQIETKSPSIADLEAPQRLVSLPEEHAQLHVSTEELRAQGHDDDYITLLQKIAMRGYEPLLPNYFKFDYRFLPDGLFEPNDEAFIGSVRGHQFPALKALESLFEIGGRVRDRVEMQAQIQPEEQVRRQMVAYLKWAQQDAGIDRRTAIPLLAMECQPANTPARMLQDNATRKCRRLAARYRKRLQAVKSVEGSPSVPANVPLPYPLPTFYAIVASHTVVAIMAYEPARTEVTGTEVEGSEPPTCTPMVYLNFENKDYDVWNALALAIVACHVRNIQTRLAEETGIGMKDPRNDLDGGQGDELDA